MFRGNKIFIVDKKGKLHRRFFIRGLKIKFKGKNSRIILHEPLIKFKKCFFTCGNDCNIEIQSSHYKATQLQILATGNNSFCKIGKDFSCTNICKILLHKESGLKVNIGNDCMFGTNIMLRCSDAHTIYDIHDLTIKNLGKDIIIGNHCWLAMNVTILKGVNINHDNIIATGSIVTKTCELPNSIYAGIPAKLVKTNVNWDRKAPESKSNFTKKRGISLSKCSM